MVRVPNGKLSWDISAIADALKISISDVREYFTDGRRVSFILERRLAVEKMNGKLATSEGAAYDLVDASGKKWEVRCISKAGIYFCPSYMVGKGRHFEVKGFLDKLDDIEGYIIAYIESFPDVPFWIVSSEEVRGWWDEGKLGTTTKVTSKKMLSLLK